MSFMGGLPDPAGMRMQAAALRRTADAAAGYAAEVEVTGAIEFEGPAADSFRAALDGDIATASRIAAQLSDLAQQISRSATQVEAQMAELARAQAAEGSP